MVINDFKEKYIMYENMAIWEIAGLDEFFKSHEMLYEIFEKEYGFKYEDRNKGDRKFDDTVLSIANRLLEYFGDKYFFIFTNGDKHHSDLKELQDKKIINFGIDVHVINPQRIYVLEMDKSKDLEHYDTI